MAVDTATTAIPVGESSSARVRRAVTRPLRRAVRFVATSDPDLSRLRHAGTTITCLIVVAIILFGLAALTGLSAAGAIPGLILTMLACNAVRDTRPKPRAVSILLMIPSSLVAVTLAALTHDVTLVADIVFVAVAMAAVFARVIGQRGVPIGMVAFMSYFIAIFTRVTPAEIPVVAVAVSIAAIVVIALRWLLRPKHPDRDLRRLIRALGVRAGRVLDVVDDGVREGVIDERLHRTATSRLAASSSTAVGAEQALASADHPLVEGLANDELSVRIFDFQLTLERLHSIVRRVLLDGSMTDEQREQLSGRLRELRRAVHAPVELSRESAPPHPAEAAPDADAAVALDTTATPIVSGHGAHVSPGGVSDSDDRLEALARVVRFGFTSWQGIVARGGDAAPSHADPADVDPAGDLPPGPDDAAVPAGPPTGRSALPQLARTAVQVGLAAALSIAAGTALSSTRWFWAVIAAFVVYVGTSTRGEILTKGWQRVVGTLGGVVLGVLIAGLVGGNLVVSLILILLSLFLGFYFMQVSSAWMIFGITTMLALLYGLLGEFSVDLLLVRLEETAAGAAIGILVSYVVFPNSTRDAMRSATRVFLGELAATLRTAEQRLAIPTPRAGAAAAAPDDARALRDAYVALTTTSKPITQGWAGVSNRSGSRRTLVILGACEYHGRALMRRADGALGAADTAGLREALDRAMRAVQADIDTFRGALDGGIADIVFHPAGDVIDQLENHPDLTGSRRHRSLIGVARHLHAIDQSLCGRGAELGAAQEPLAADVRPTR
ncbi:putative membrane protein YccC [Frondihabitans sp. PhB188]|uniref:FUSC family protein n=1 Tax=Frondihabitans sp. PhB188 TaxID=2485200 RepID=UPI000F49A244|nr:FUSC family protein [Frondihabitans sp. PhB188]ROQ36530.1 putative membrane protein YccC [Frondihabitans sp. PhB188]